MVFRELPDVFPNSGKCVAAVGGQVLADAEGRQKGGVVRKDFPRRLAAVKFAEQSAYGLDDERIRVTCEDATPIPHLRHQPEFREATGKEIRIHALLGTKDRTCPGFLHQTSEAILPVF